MDKVYPARHSRRKELGKFTMVFPALWDSRRFMALPDSDAKLLFIYYLTNKHQTSIGAYVIPTGYAVVDLGWDVARYHKARATLVTAGLIAFDEEISTVYVEGWFKYCFPYNDMHAKGCQAVINRLKSKSIAAKVQADFDASEAKRPPDKPRRSKLPPEHSSAALLNGLNTRHQTRGFR